MKLVNNSIRCLVPMITTFGFARLEFHVHLASHLQGGKIIVKALYYDHAALNAAAFNPAAAASQPRRLEQMFGRYKTL